MPTLAIAFPQIDPVLIAFGPFAIRWYALGYIAGLFGGAWYMRRLVKAPPALMKPEQVDDFVIWALIGIVAGGRLGYVLFYKPLFFLDHPLEILKTWEGGMSFHGGLLGMVAAIILFARKYKLDQWYVGDHVACVAPIGIALVRLANFINGELWGRVAPDVPWAMVFPDGGPEPRHPSQLYEAFSEGLVLLIVLHVLWRIPSVRHRPGILAGVFWIGYGVLRTFGELFREPDAHLGFLIGGATMGQFLSVPMILIGIAFIVRAKPLPQAA